MIIVSQDKDNVVNFDNVIGIRTATDKENNKERLIAIDTMDGEIYYIAKYATEERAKEVLQEITNTFAIKGVQDTTYQYADIWIKMRQYAIYEMPKE